MKFLYQKKSLKDLAGIPSKTRAKIEHAVFHELVQQDSIIDSGIVEAMKGYPSYYKIRFGSYRVGLKIE